MYKFKVSFLNLGSKKVEIHFLETHSVGQALRAAMAITKGKDTQDVSIIQIE